ncbi:hypothetical protein LRQ20_18235, partial [Pseudomonas sp. MAFF 311096]
PCHLELCPTTPSAIRLAMAVVKGGLKRIGERVFSPQADGSVIEAEIVSSVFFDPKGERQNI